MEILTVKRGETIYTLQNLTTEHSRELQNDSQKLTSYFNDCLQTGLNICIQENDSLSLNGPSTSSASNVQRKRKFSFLCGTFEKRNFIYAIKFANHPWHYFTEKDSLSSQHGCLPASIDSMISKLDKLKSIDLILNEEQWGNYYNDDNDEFIFQNKALETRMQLANKKVNQTSELNSCHRVTNRLLFISGQHNPMLFLNDFEKCRDLKTDKDKMYQIRSFVDDCHRAEFTKLYFNSDWETIRSAFLKIYSVPFVRNKKRELQVDFNESDSLRWFVEQKLMSLSKYTTLPLINQMEMVCNDLPEEISILFITNEIMTCDKTKILDFCDSIQDLVETMRNPTEDPLTTNQESNLQSNASNQMEIFDYESEPPEPEPMSIDDEPQSSRGRGRGRGRGRAKGRAKGIIRDMIKNRGRPPKNLNSILEADESNESSSGYDFLNQIDNTSRSSWSDD